MVFFRVVAPNHTRINRGVYHHPQEAQQSLPWPQLLALVLEPLMVEVQDQRRPSTRQLVVRMQQSVLASALQGTCSECSVGTYSTHMHTPTLTLTTPHTWLPLQAWLRGQAPSVRGPGSGRGARQPVAGADAQPDSCGPRPVLRQLCQDHGQRQAIKCWYRSWV